MKDTFKAIKSRRTIYALGDSSPIPDQEIIDIVEFAVKHVPTAFNSQSTRAVLLFGDNHRKVWEMTLEILRKMVPEAAFKNTEKKINSFAAGYGTILFFDETKITKKFADDFPTYKDNFPIWADQASGMMQFAIWCLLEEAGLGANLQHYNPLIDNDVKSFFKLPDSWRLIAQMVFGAKLQEADKKEFAPIEERLKIFK